MSQTYDYIIVGGGSAGCAAARRLAEDPTLTVCLLEAGPSDEGNDMILRLSRWSELLFTEFDYAYKIAHQPRGNSAMVHSRAKCLGGCSSHNSCIAFVAPDSDMNEWAELGCKGWEADKTHKFFDQVRGKVNITPVLEGDNALNKAFVESGMKAGFPLQEFNTPEYQKNFNESVGFLQVNCDGEWRASSSYSYLHPIEKLPSNLTVKCNVNVSKILLNKEHRAHALETDHGVFTANEEIVISAGAFDTPKLLMLSGIGPKWHLREKGLECKVNIAGVGAHLIDHPEGVICWETNAPVPTKIRQKYEAALFANTQKTSNYPDLMFHFGLESFDMQTTPHGYPTAPVGWGISLTPNVTKAKSQGTVRLRSSNPTDPAVIDFKYFTDDEGHDEAVMIEGIKLARKIAALEPLKGWIKRELAPGSDCQTDKEISEYVRKTSNTVYHPAGTCKMGNVATDKLAVVDSQLRVTGGIKGLRIADASVFPSHLLVNPNITCMMVGERCADFIKEGRKKNNKAKL